MHVCLCVCAPNCSVVSDSVIPQTVAIQAPLSIEFSRQEYCSGLPFPSPGDLLDSGIQPRSPALQADSLSSEPLGKPLLCVKFSNIKFIHTDVQPIFRYHLAKLKLVTH